jgi:putative ABC transport system substrate-binding protein
MRRRDFIKALALPMGSWPIALRAQQAATPTIGFLSSASRDVYAIRLDAFYQGLKEAGYVEGQNVQIEYRWAEGHNDRLRALADELVQRQVAVIVAGGGTPTAVAAKAATAIIPIVFEVAVDPIEIGFAASLGRPGGNMTGVTNLNVDIGQKRLELMREVLPSMNVVAVLVNPANPALAEPFARVMQAVSDRLGMRLLILKASVAQDFDAVFATLTEQRAGALVIGPDVFFNTHIEELAALALRHAMPTIYQYRPFTTAGGLLSYGSDETETYRLVGIYAGKILKGEKPADLPIVQSTKVELIVNLKTAKALGLTIPLPLLGRADEVIE